MGSSSPKEHGDGRSWTNLQAEGVTTWLSWAPRCAWCSYNEARMIQQSMLQTLPNAARADKKLSKPSYIIPHRLSSRLAHSRNPQLPLMLPIPICLKVVQ